MASILERISSVLVPQEPTVGIDQIPPTTEVVDCATCDPDCDQYPSYLDLDTTSELLGSMLPYGRHVLIHTGVTDWPERIEDDTPSFAARLLKVINNDDMQNGRILVTNTSLVSSSSSDGSVDITLFPENILIHNVDDVQAFYDCFLNKPLPLQPIQLCMIDSPWLIRLNPFSSMVLICSHRRRDKRCGVTAPILAREFDHVLRNKDIEEQGDRGVVVAMVSHVGGHKFAGNLICYTHQGTRGIWYGRVRPGHCRQIVEDTLLRGKVVKDLYRGSMMHSYGPTSFMDSATCPARIRW